MLHSERLIPSRVRDQRGFTLIVILIIGILASIALPAFLNQRTKAQDSTAKTAVRNARTTLETFHTDRQSYNTDVATVEDMEPALRDALNLAVTGTDDTFTVSVDSKARDGGGTYSIELDSSGDVTRSCTNPGKGGCRQNPDSQGNLW